MARGTSRRGSAQASASLTSLLAPTQIPIYGPSVELPDYLGYDPVEAYEEAVYGDRRQYHPGRMPPLYTTVRSAGRLMMGRTNPLQFKGPIRHIKICMQRAIRREVLHAFGQQRKGGGGGGPRRRNAWSGIKC